MSDNFVELITFLDYFDFDKERSVDDESVVEFQGHIKEIDNKIFEWDKQIDEEKIHISKGAYYELGNVINSLKHIENLYIKKEDVKHISRLFDNLYKGDSILTRVFAIYEVKEKSFKQKLNVHIIGKRIKTDTIGGLLEIVHLYSDLSAYQNIVTKHVHDIKNQIMMMLALVNNIQKDTEKRSIKKHSYELRETLYSCSYMLSLMEFNGRSKNRYRLFNMHHVIASILDSFGFENNIIFTTEINADNPRIYADKVLITNVIYNVVINAIQELEHMGCVTIKTYNRIDNPQSNYECEGWLCIEISDDGSGVDEEILGRIFEQYFTTKTGGSGLGLYSSMITLNQHNGTINVVSKKGEGASFTICLPSHIE